MAAVRRAHAHLRWAEVHNACCDVLLCLQATAERGVKRKASDTALTFMSDRTFSACPSDCAQ
mgnify:CR=1 FL=1